ncbi:glycoprotein precursor [Wenzhou Shrimp Virus 1]|uniref:Envelopment polyprotein n=1 Tax=Wenzhou Shrimp Virus 1 TaxID=1608095 RepID=A0A0B5KFF4_9VIRU|nr:glycoprotein precursor [Wenzhou Shrimp Virus 1]AJG39289.1 glycoprotein precursor [Wenzhou Shrimp Virus 1]
MMNQVSILMIVAPLVLPQNNQSPGDMLTAGVGQCSQSPPRFPFADPTIKGAKTIQWVDLFNRPKPCYHQVTSSKDCYDELGNVGGSCNSNDSTVMVDNINCQVAAEVGSVRDSPDLCSINGHVLRACSETRSSLEWVWWVFMYREGRQVRFLDTLHKKVTHNVMDSGNFHCTNNKTEGCNGDLAYCANHACEPASSCFCTTTMIGITSLVVEGQEIVPTCYGRSLARVNREVTLEVELMQLCTDCKFKCTDEGIKISTFIPEAVSGMICRSPFCMHIVVQNEANIRLPLDMRVTTEEMTITLWFHGNYDPFVNKMTCVYEQSCALITCHFCLERVLNPHCFSWLHWLMILILILLIVTIIRKVIHILFCVKWALSCLWKLIPRIRRRKRSGADQAERGLLPSGGEATRKMRAALGLTLLATGHCCSTSITSQADIQDCSQGSDGTETCVFNHGVNLHVSPIGQESCYFLQDSKGEHLDHLRIKARSIQLKCEKQSLYYVPRAVGKCTSVSHCSTVSGCSAKACLEFKANGSLPEWTSEMDHYGWSRCQGIPGCAANGCFYCDDGCLWWREYFTNPKSEVYEIIRCPTWVFVVDLEVVLSNITTPVVLSPGATKAVGSVRLSLEALSAPPEPILGDCFYQLGPVTRLGPCNERGSLSPGKVGELQCPSKESARRADASCFANEAMVRTTVSTAGVSCHFSIVDPGNVGMVLPYKGNGFTILSGKSGIVAHSTSTALLSLNIQLGKLIVKKEKARYKCHAQFVKLTGCYSCMSGATLTVLVGSTADASEAVLNCPDVNYTTIVVANKVEESVTSTLHLTQSVIDMKCEVVCPSSRTYLDVTGNLLYIPDVDPETRTMSVDVHQNGASFTLNPLGSYKSAILYAGIVILSLLALSILLPLIRTSVKTKTS